METILSNIEVLRRFVQKLGPYLMLEMLLPGGTLMALLLFLYRRAKLNAGKGALSNSRFADRLWDIHRVAPL